MGFSFGESFWLAEKTKVFGIFAGQATLSLSTNRKDGQYNTVRPNRHIVVARAQNC